MPRTKLDKLALSPFQVRARLIRSAGCRAGYFRDKDLADAAGLDGRRLSDRYCGRVDWSADDIKAIDRIVRFSDAEISQIVRGKFKEKEE